MSSSSFRGAQPERLSEPQRSPPPPRPDRLQPRSPWSPATTYTPLSAGRVKGTTPTSPPRSVHLFGRQSTAKTYRQLDWSVEETSSSPRSPRRPIQNASLLPESSTLSDGPNHSGIRVLSRSFDPSRRQGALLGGDALQYGASVDETMQDNSECDLAEALGDRLTTLAVVYAGAVARAEHEDHGFVWRTGTEATDKGGCQVVSQRVSKDVLPSDQKHRSGKGAVLFVGLQRLMCSFDVARHVLAQPTARSHWDTDLVDVTVQSCFDRRRTALVCETRLRAPVETHCETCETSLQLYAAREELWTAALRRTCPDSASEESPRRAAVRELVTVLPVDESNRLVPQRACVWATSAVQPIPETSDAASPFAEHGDSTALTGVVLLEVAGCDYESSLVDARQNGPVWVAILQSATDPRQCNASKIRAQCQRLAALCALEQKAAEASSTSLEQSPLRFPKPPATSNPAEATSPVVSGTACAALYTRLTVCLSRSLATRDVTQRLSSAPEQTPQRGRRRPPSAAAAVDSVMWHSPDPRQPPLRLSPLQMSSTASSSSFVPSSPLKSPSHAGQDVAPPVASPAHNRGRPQQATSYRYSPALSQNLDGLSSIQPTAGGDVSLQALPSPRLLNERTLTVQALREHHRRATSAAAAAQQQALHDSPFHVAPRSPSVKLTLLCCTGLPRFADDAGDGRYRLGVVARLSHGDCTTSAWYPYAPDVHFRTVEGRCETTVLHVSQRDSALSSGVSLTVTVVVQTPHKKIRLGVAALQVGNLRRHQVSVFACHIIGKAGTVAARERCLLHLSLTPSAVGLATHMCVPLTEEVRRRQLIWRTMVSHAPAQMHRLEWLVGLCRPATFHHTDVDQLIHRLVKQSGSSDERVPVTRTAPRTNAERRTVSARPFRSHAVGHDSSVTATNVHSAPGGRRRRTQAGERRHPGALPPTNDDQYTLRETVPRRSLSAPLLRRAVGASPRVTSTECTTPALTTKPEGQTYAVQLRVMDVCNLCDRHGELLSSCASVFIVVTVHARPGIRRGARSWRLSAPSAAEQVWTTDSVPYTHHAAAFTERAIELRVDDLYDTVARLTVMAGNTACHTVVGFCDVSLRYMAAVNESVASDQGAAGRPVRLYCDATPCARASHPPGQPPFTLAGSMTVDVRCQPTPMGRYLAPSVMREALAWKARHALAVSALLLRYKPNLLPSVDVQLDQLASHGLDAFVRRKEQLWGRTCTLSGLACVHVRVLGWSLYSTRTASAVVRDPQRFTAIADPRAIRLHHRRLQGSGRTPGSQSHDWFSKARVDAVNEEHAVTLYTVAHCGGAVFAKTRAVPTVVEGLNLTAQFNERLSPHVAEPATDVLSLRVLQVVTDGGVDYEVGRVDVPLSVFHGPSSGTPQRMTLPLIANAGTAVAYSCCTLSLEIRVDPLHVPGQTHTPAPTVRAWRGFDDTWTARTRLVSLLYRCAPWLLHRAHVLLKDVYTDAQADALCAHCTAQFGCCQHTSIGLTLVALRLVDKVAKKCYVKVYHENAVVMRTAALQMVDKTGDGVGEAVVHEKDGGCAQLDVSDPAHDVVHVKVGQSKRLGRNKVIATSQISLACAVSSAPSHAAPMWIPLFEVAESHSWCVGEVCVKLTRHDKVSPPPAPATPPMPQVPLGEAHLCTAAVDAQDMQDVVSLLQSYAPTALDRVHTLMMASAAIAEDGPQTGVGHFAHPPLRAMLAPLSVSTTVYVNVVGIELLHGDLLPIDLVATDTFQLAVSTWGSPVGTCVCPITTQKKASSTSQQHTVSSIASVSLTGTVARVDIPSPMAAGDAALEQTALDLVLEHTTAVGDEREAGVAQRRGRSSGSAHSGLRRTSVSRSCSSGGPRDASVGRESSGGRTDPTTANSEEEATTGSLAVPIGHCRASLRALLTPKLYAAGEVVSLPLVCSARTLSFRLTARQRKHFEQALASHGVAPSQDWFVLGHLRLSVRLASHEHAPAWLRLSAPFTTDDDVTGRRAFVNTARRLTSENDFNALSRVHYDVFETSRQCPLSSSFSPPPAQSVPQPKHSPGRRRARSGVIGDRRLGAPPQTRRRASPAPRNPAVARSRTVVPGQPVPTRLTEVAPLNPTPTTLTVVSTPSWTLYSPTVTSQRLPHDPASHWEKQVVGPRTGEHNSEPEDLRGLTLLVSPSTVNGTTHAR